MPLAVIEPLQYFLNAIAFTYDAKRDFFWPNLLQVKRIKIVNALFRADVVVFTTE
jgi:hypothetical protein